MNRFYRAWARLGQWLIMLPEREPVAGEFVRAIIKAQKKANTPCLSYTYTDTEIKLQHCTLVLFKGKEWTCYGWLRSNRVVISILYANIHGLTGGLDFWPFMFGNRQKLKVDLF